MESVLFVNPFNCRVWQLHDRLDDYITEESCKDEIESFLEHGQLVPVLGRRVPQGAGCDVELIYGARRLFVARHLNKPLLVELRDLSDREAVIALDIENRQRRDVSPYERGLCYARWLRASHFESQDDIARALNVSPSQVSRLLKLARLPSVVVGAFESGVDIHERWGLDLIDAIEDPDRRKAVIRMAREIAAASARPSAEEIYRRLLSSSGRGRKPRADAHDRVIKGGAGVALFRVRRQRSSVALILPIERLSNKTLENIERTVAGILEDPVRVERRPLPREVELRVKPGHERVALEALASG